MQAVLLSILMGAVRQSLTVVSAEMIRRGWITDEQNTQLVIGIAGLLSSLVWLAYTKYRDRLSLLTAAAMPPSTPNEVEAVVKTSAPAVTSSPDLVPALKPGNSER